MQPTMINITKETNITSTQVTQLETFHATNSGQHQEKKGRHSIVRTEQKIGIAECNLRQK